MATRPDPGLRFFLSYRRDDSSGHAGRLSDHLLDRFGKGSVFVDVDSIEAGADFTAEIESALSDSEAVLVVIGPGWLDARTTAGSRRLEEPNDFVRREVEAALASEVRVIPVLVGGASMPAESELPVSISELARRNAIELLDRRWREDVDALIEVLEGRGRGALGNLPVQLTPFLGRERELAEITELLRRQEVRLLTLTGPGGIGKTRLSVQAASKLAHTYPGGAWFVGLAAVTDPSLLVSEIATVLDAADASEDRLLQAIAERLSRARALLVLDNLEQLLPRAAASVAELCAAVPSVDVLASSREPLHVSAEREFPVPVLAVDESVDLFGSAARAADPSFTVDGGAERAVIVSICERLDRLPLAIELAASRARILGPAALLERLDQRLPLLTGGAHDVPERQRTLRATIAWSVDLLSEEERGLFERLAVFSGGWPLEAAEAVCEADLDRLQSLVERNLVRHADERFTMLETIREFASEGFEHRPDANDVRRRHASYLSTVAEAAWRGVKSPDEQRWIRRLRQELNNFRGALDWSLDGGDPDLALVILVGICYVWLTGGSISEGRRWLDRGLERSSPSATGSRAWALEWAGMLAYRQGDLASATRSFTESIRCAREAGTPDAEAMAMSHLSGLIPLDRPEEKLSMAQQAVQIARGHGDPWLVRATLNNLGETFREVGDGTGALRAYEESLAVYRRVGMTSGAATVLTNLAELALAEGDVPRAGVLAVEAVETSERFANEVGTGLAVETLGWVALAEGRPADAADRFRDSLEVIRDAGHLFLAPSPLLGLAGAAAAEHDMPRAARLEGAAHHAEQVLGRQPTASDAGIHLPYLDELRAVAAPDAWEAEASAGRAMELDAAIAYALREVR